jgi:hypothetical protein
LGVVCRRGLIGWEAKSRDVEERDSEAKTR